MMFKCSIRVPDILHQYLLFYNIILLFILIISEEANLFTLLLVGMKLLIELSAIVMHLFGIVSLKMFPQMFHTLVLKIYFRHTHTYMYIPYSTLQTYYLTIDL